MGVGNMRRFHTLTGRRAYSNMPIRRCITARKPLDGERERWLWAVFVHERVVTAWVRKNASIQRIAPDTVTKGDIWNAVDLASTACTGETTMSGSRRAGPGGRSPMGASAGSLCGCSVSKGGRRCGCSGTQ